jgi:hypothetical protein
MILNMGILIPILRIMDCASPKNATVSRGVLVCPWETVALFLFQAKNSTSTDTVTDLEIELIGSDAIPPLCGAKLFVPEQNT